MTAAKNKEGQEILAKLEKLRDDLDTGEHIDTRLHTLCDGVVMLLNVVIEKIKDDMVEDVKGDPDVD
jgi:hypothetical protein